MFHKWLCAIALLCADIYVAEAQQCSLSVKVTVVETHNFAPVFPAIVYVEETRRAYETNEQGVVKLDSLCPGKYTVHVETAGHEHLVEHFSVTGNASYRLKVAMLEHQLAEVHVSEERHRTILQSRGSLDKGELNANTGKSLGDMLQSVNGVSTLGNGATITKPVIHGLHSNRILMLNNGIRQEDQQWGGEHAPNIDPFLASNITVIKGAAGVRYGTDAMGGVVLVEPPALRNTPGWNGELNLAGFSNNGMYVGSGMVEHAFKAVPGLAFRVQGTYKKGGNYRIPGHWVANTGVRETNFSGALAYRKLHYGAEVFFSHFDTDLGLYRGSHTGSEKDLMNAINSPVPLIPATFTYRLERPRQHVEHTLGKARAYADTRAGVFNLTYAYQRNFRQEYDVVRIDRGNAQLNLTLNTQTLNLNFDHKKIKGIEGQAGVDGIYQENYLGQGDRIFIPNFRAWGGAAYLVERYKARNYTIEAGVRYDNRYYDVYNPEGNNQQVVNYKFHFSNISGTLGFRQQLTDRWDWGLTLGRAWRAPQASELFSQGLHQGAARIEVGNKNLRPEASWNLNAETKYTAKKWLAELSLYSQHISDFIYLAPGVDILTIRGYFKRFDYRQTDALLSGADATVTYQWTGSLQSTAKASVLYARDITNRDWLILMPANRFSLGNKYTHSFSERWQDAFVALDARYVAQQNRIPANFDEVDYPRPPAAYFLLDASIGSTLFINKQPLHLSLSVDNLLNAKYRDYLDAFRYFIDQPGRNVVLRINIPFNSKKSNEQ
ncbi:MAG: TonB-dependent receptor [Flavipsychrobacter sp.]|nr:TonB-dependent receptor [Flavipsychrobacter sp.]